MGSECYPWLQNLMSENKIYALSYSCVWRLMKLSRDISVSSNSKIEYHVKYQAINLGTFWYILHCKIWNRVKRSLIFMSSPHTTEIFCASILCRITSVECFIGLISKPTVPSNDLQRQSHKINLHFIISVFLLPKDVI